MILSDHDILCLLPDLIPDPSQRDESLVNPASLDIRIGATATREGDSEVYSVGENFILRPQEFVLIATYEHIRIPNGYAADLRLKSSIARKGFNHSLAFWVDPGWDGILTMEVQNVLRFTELNLAYGQRFAQLIIHRLTSYASHPYNGRYQGAKKVEDAKP